MSTHKLNYSSYKQGFSENKFSLRQNMAILRWIMVLTYPTFLFSLHSTYLPITQYITTHKKFLLVSQALEIIFEMQRKTLEIQC
jgi:hypothetical protein